MRKAVVLLMAALLLLSLVGLLSASETRDGPSAYPIWCIGDKYVFNTTYWNPAVYTSYTYYSYDSVYEVKNTTTVTTPYGTFNAYGVSVWTFMAYMGSGTGYSFVGNSSTTGTYYYRTSDLALVATDTFVQTHSITVSTITVYMDQYTDSYTYYKPPVDTWEYPIKVGESWSVGQLYNYTYDTMTYVSTSGTTYSSGSNDYSYNTVYNCSAQGSTTVLAGTYSTLTVKQGSGSSYSVMYFEPNMGWYVKLDSYSSGSLAYVMELSSCTFSPPPSVKPESFDFSMNEDATDTTHVDLSAIFSSAKTLTYSCTHPSSMSVSIGAAGNVTFKPAKDWNGVANVVFKADDGVKNATKQVKVTVLPVNDPPEMDPLPEVAFNEGSSVYAIDLALYANDADNNASDLTFYVEPTANITAIIQMNNTVRFSAPEYWFGTEYVGFKAKDLAAYSGVRKAKVTVNNLNNPPELDALSDISVSQYDFLNFTPSATDRDADVLTFGTNLTEAIPGLTTSEYTFNPSNGSFSLHPCAQALIGLQTAERAYPVSFWVFDGKVRDHANVTITIVNVNDAPVAVDDFTYDITDADTVQAGKNNLTVRFLAPAVTDMDGDEVAFSWDFGDGKTGTGIDFNHTFAKAGNYSVILSYTDNIIPEPITQSTLVAVTAPRPPAADDDVTPDDDVEPDDDVTPDDDVDDDTDDDVIPDDDDDTGNNTNGTDDDDRVSSMGTILLCAAIGLVVLILIVAVLIIVVIAVRRKKEPKPDSQTQALTPDTITPPKDLGQQAHQVSPAPPAQTAAAPSGNPQITAPPVLDAEVEVLPPEGHEQPTVIHQPETGMPPEQAQGIPPMACTECGQSAQYYEGRGYWCENCRKFAVSEY